MKRLFESANQYLRASDWKDMALLKFCLAAMGILLGIAVPERRKKPVAFVAMGVFVATYIPLMLKYLPFLQNAAEEEDA